MDGRGGGVQVSVSLLQLLFGVQALPPSLGGGALPWVLFWTFDIHRGKLCRGGLSEVVKV
ncbi:hypothetical protein EJ04DRAFT_513931 [Polyplosphaeria fusca]|uniref:Uncharacterized protein n=1 Tax=Polyplosphaeria fusca TaxID=682080 RepID=A0A9P4UZE6_9PLEO|nr:hypothetical protein EJ04DRAFT_513931 [Polyplosphaeria fusca]